MSNLLPLSHLATGEIARICQVSGNPAQVHRLEELGLRSGAEIEVIQSGSPCIVRLAGHKLCFRADDLLRVLVQCEQVAGLRTGALH